MVPGRLQLENPSGLYHTANMRVDKTTNTVEFLRKKQNLNYTWVDAQSNRCINDAVMVEGEFYIGRVLDGDYAFIGQVKIGDRGIKYENDQGYAVYTNDYEVLTCSEIPTKPVDEECLGELEECNKNSVKYSVEVSNLKKDVQILEAARTSCLDMQKLLKANNDLLNEKVIKLEKDCGCTNPDIDIQPNCTQLPPTPCVDNSKTLDELRTQVNDLQAQNQALTQRVTQGSAGLENKIKKLQDELNAAKQVAKTLKTQNTELVRENVKLRAENLKLKNDAATMATCVGAAGCETALNAISFLTENEQMKLLVLIRSKMGQIKATTEGYDDY